MPEVPDAQGASREEQLLSQEANPAVQPVQEGVTAPQQLVDATVAVAPLDPSQPIAEPIPAGNPPEQPQEVQGQAKVAETVEEPPYEEGQVYGFVDPSGVGYSIVIQGVEGEKLTILNQSVPGAQPAEISLEDAKNMFVNGKLVQ